MDYIDVNSIPVNKLSKQDSKEVKSAIKQLEESEATIEEYTYYFSSVVNNGATKINRPYIEEGAPKKQFDRSSRTIKVPKDVNPAYLLAKIYNFESKDINNSIFAVIHILEYYPERITWLDHYQDLLLTLIGLLKQIRAIRADNPTKEVSELEPLYDRSYISLKSLEDSLVKEGQRIVKVDTKDTEIQLNAYQKRVEQLVKKDKVSGE